jgi:acyl-coenzyme A thioesterase PaaI-like protein
VSILRRLASGAAGIRRVLNLYGPYLGAGVRVRHIAEDFSEIRVEMKLHWYNRNYVGTHFGGSLYSMVDPFYMLMLINRLGRDYIVWDKSAQIEFVRPGTGRVHATFVLNDDTLETVRRETADGERYLPTWTVKVTDDNDELVARVKKTLYVKRKQAA